jgi:hypothetical protein
MTPEQKREGHRQAQARYYAKNRDKYVAWEADHRDGRLARKRLRDGERKEQRLHYARQWRRDHPEHFRQRYQTEEHLRVAHILRGHIHSALVHRATGKEWRSHAKIGAILGCSKADLIAHIEAQFLPGMSWANYGRKGWEIDHIKPCVTFDLTQHAQVLLCFHFSNLRPLWRSDNARRSRKE